MNKEFKKAIDQLRGTIDEIEFFAAVSDYTDATLARGDASHQLREIQEKFLTPKVIDAPVDPQFTFTKKVF